jgi:Tol biopolymer transport system component
MMRAGAVDFVVLAVLGAVLCAGCGTVGLELEELPGDPIAVTYWEGEEARRRAELLDEEKARLEEAQKQKHGVARAEAIGRLLGAGEDVEGLSRYPGRLVFVDPRTSAVTRVPDVPPGALPLAWSDDHDRLLFLSGHRGSIQVYEYSRREQEVRTVTSGATPHLFADYGLGAQHALLAVVTEPQRRFERVYVTDIAGGSPRMLFENQNAETIRLAPDGQTLLYVRRSPRRLGSPDRPSQLIALDLKTGQERDLGPGREPSFSPTGDWIVYSAPTRDGWRLRRMRPDGSAKSPIASGIRDETMPSVSPDGRFVVYVGETGGLQRLFVRRMDGSGDRILLDAGAVFAPAW